MQANLAEEPQDVQEMFMQADGLLFKESKYEQAEDLYRQILSHQTAINQKLPQSAKNERILIDAWNSIAYCIRFKIKQQRAQQSESPRDLLISQDSNQTQIWELGEDFLPTDLIPQIRDIYEQALSYDTFDIEANFNLAGILMQIKDYDQALIRYKNCVQKDLVTVSGERLSVQYSQIRQIFKIQFQKAYFNMGVINDRMGDIEEACTWYEKALERGIGLMEHQSLASFANIIDWDSVFHVEKPSLTTVKAACNLSVSYEKLGNRQAAMDILNGLKHKLLSRQSLMSEFGIYLEGLANNLGVIQRRNGQIKNAEDSFKLAISLHHYKSDDDISTQQKTLNNISYNKESSSATKQNDFIQVSSTSPVQVSHQEQFYRTNLIRFFPVYNLAVTNSKARKFDEAIEIFKDSLKLLIRMQNLTGQVDASPNIIYFVNVYTNMSLIYEKKLQFQNALFCLNQACSHSQNRNQRLASLQERMQKIVDALKCNIISLDHFDKTFYNPNENDNVLESQMMAFLSTDGKIFEQNRQINFEKGIYRIDSFDKDILGGSSNLIQSVQSRRSYPRHGIDSRNQSNNGQVYKNGKQQIMQKNKQQSKFEFNYNDQSNWNDQFNDEVKQKRQYFRKGNTTNLPENEINRLSANKYQKNGTLSNDDCNNQQSVTKMRTMNEQMMYEQNNKKYHLMQSLDNSPENSPFRDLSPFVMGQNQNSNYAPNDQQTRNSINYLAQVQIQNIRPKMLHHYKGDPTDISRQKALLQHSNMHESLSSGRRNNTTKSLKLGQSLDSRLKQNQYNPNEFNSNKMIFNEASINQSRDINLSIHDDKHPNNVSQKRVFEVQSDSYMKHGAQKYTDPQVNQKATNQYNPDIERLFEQNLSSDQSIPQQNVIVERDYIHEQTQQTQKTQESGIKSDQNQINKNTKPTNDIDKYVIDNDQLNNTIQSIDSKNVNVPRIAVSPLDQQNNKPAVCINDEKNQMPQQNQNKAQQNNVLPVQDDYNDIIQAEPPIFQKHQSNILPEKKKSIKKNSILKLNQQQILTNQIRSTEIKRNDPVDQQSNNRTILKDQSKKLSEVLNSQDQKQSEKNNADGGSNPDKSKISNNHRKNSIEINLSQSNIQKQKSLIKDQKGQYQSNVSKQKTMKPTGRSEKSVSQNKSVAQTDEERIQATRERLSDTERSLQDGNIKEAISTYNKILHELQTSFLNKLGKKSKNNKIEQQQRELEQKVAFQVAELYYKCKDYSKGIEMVEKILNQSAQNLNDQQKFNFQMLKGKALDMKGDYSQAVEVFGKNLKEYILKNTQTLDKVKSQMEIGDLEFRYGWSLIRSKQDIEQGVQKLKEAEKKMPDNLDLKVKLAQILFQEQGKLDEALGYLQMVLNKNTDNHEAMYLKGKILLKQKEYKLAEQSIQNAINTQNKNKVEIRAGILFHLGQSQELQKDYQKAFGSFKQALTIDPKHFGSAIHLGSISEILGDVENALKYFKLANSIDSGSLIVNFALGKLYYEHEMLGKRDHNRRAVEFFEQVLKKKADHHKSLYHIGNIYFKEGKFQLAQQYLQKCLRAKDNFIPALICMGNLMFENQQSLESLNMHQKVLQIAPENIEAILGIANACYDLKKMSDSIQMYERAIKLSKGSKLPGPPGDVHYNLANAYYASKEVDQSIRCYIKSLELYPKRIECLYNLGNAYFQKGSFSNARDQFKLAFECAGQDRDPSINNSRQANAPQISSPSRSTGGTSLRGIHQEKLNKQQVDILFNLANTEVMMDKNREAIEKYEVVLKFQEDNVVVKERVLNSLGNTYFNIGNLEQSQKYFEQSLKCNPQSIDCMLGLAKVYQKQQNYKKAIQLYDAANKLLPEDQDQRSDEVVSQSSMVRNSMTTSQEQLIQKRDKRDKGPQKPVLKHEKRSQSKEIQIQMLN